MGEKFVLSATANSVKLTLCTVGKGGGKRGEACGISRQSKTRLLDLLNSVLWDSVYFVTLTYKQNETDKDVAYKGLRALYKRFCYEFGPAGWIWRRETQKRGAYHFHVFMFDCAVTKSWLSVNWSAVTGNAGSVAHRRYGVHVVDVGKLEASDAGVVVSYMVKYAKKDGASDGRAWGVLGACHLRTIRFKADVDMMAASLIVDAIKRAGGKQVTADDCPAVSWAVYLGHLGKVAGPGGGSVLEFVRSACGVDLVQLLSTTGVNRDA